jgi:hypothetical protein
MHEEFCPSVSAFFVMASVLFLIIFFALEKFCHFLDKIIGKVCSSSVNSTNIANFISQN